jgi:7-cyano-7-deazaguanine synthase
LSEKKTGAVILLSGGMDSTVLLHHVARTQSPSPLISLSFNYGQRHTKELVEAEWQAARVGVDEHRVTPIEFIGELVSAGTTLVYGGAAVPDLDDVAKDALSQPPTYVPNRNMMLLSIAAAFAEAQGIHDVYYGAQAHDEYGYWDCTAEFLERINHILSLNRRKAVTIHAPFVADKKASLVRMGMDLGVDFERTWSCYRGGDQPCGTCPTCVERRNAFAEAGFDDPLLSSLSEDTRAQRE